MKLFGFQRAFHEKPFGRSLRRKPQPTMNTKNADFSAFFICRNMLELRSKPCFKGLFAKSLLKIRKNFPQIHHFILAKLLRFQRTFHEKSFVSGFGAEAPTDNAHKKTRRNPRFLYCQYVLELRSKPCFKELLKKLLKNPQNFCKSSVL